MREGAIRDARVVIDLWIKVSSPCLWCRGTGRTADHHPCTVCGGVGFQRFNADRPEGCRAPHCWSEYGTPCGTCPAATPDPPDDDDWQEQEAMIGTALPAASPDERLREAGVWPDQSAMHGVLLDQIKDAYAEGIADTLDRIRVRAAEMLPEVARFTLDEIEALAAADREAPDEKVRAMTLPDGESYCPPAADREKPERICCRGMGADGGCNICAAEATR